MPWQLQPAAHETFHRNALVVVVAQIRFHPILKVPERIGDFQERVRDVFPVFQRVEATTIDVGSPGAPSIRVNKEQQFLFRPAEVPDVTLSLSASSLALEYRRYRSRSELQAQVRLGWDALRGTYGKVSTTRLGLRYVNRFDRPAIERDLGRTVAWPDLIRPECASLPVPGQPVGDDLVVSTEVSGLVASGGAMTLRCGRPPGGREFRLDIDRFQDGYDGSVEPVVLLERYADDVFGIFRSFTMPTLDAWLRGQP